MYIEQFGWSKLYFVEFFFHKICCSDQPKFPCIIRFLLITTTQKIGNKCLEWRRRLSFLIIFNKREFLRLIVKMSIPEIKLPDTSC